MVIDYSCLRVTQKVIMIIDSCDARLGLESPENWMILDMINLYGILCNFAICESYPTFLRF